MKKIALLIGDTTKEKLGRFPKYASNNLVKEIIENHILLRKKLYLKDRRHNISNNYE